MKTNTVFNAVVGLIATTTFSFAQTGFPCGTSDYNNRLRNQHLNEVLPAEQQLQQETQLAFQNANQRSTASFIIPVVFHIVHDYGVENISDAQVYDQMAILNRDYAKLNADTASIIPSFDSIASAMNIEFRLATIDPEGNCTNGIDRIASKLTYNADDKSKLNPWPRNKYLNIWVVRSIGSSGVAGYAYYPSAVIGLGAVVDGVLILHDYIGSIGTGSVTTSRALTHEIGHYLNLAHPWGSTNNPGVACGDDGIPDTPQTKGWSYCPSPNASRVCNTSIFENYQNYMDYSYCSVMFTHDQRLAMHATLNSNVSDRNRLSMYSNLVATGTANVTTANCAPHADFSCNHSFVCAGGTIQFTDESWGGTVSNRTWVFQGGNPATSTAASPTITYANAGQYEVSLVVSNAQGQDSVIRSRYITIGNTYGEVLAPYSESFENSNVLSNGWYVINHSNNNTYWYQTPWVAATGNSSLIMNNYLNDGGDVDELVTPQFDMRYMTSMTASFKIAFATRVSDTSLLKEKLRFLVSTNCGQTWTQLLVKKGTQLTSGGLNSGVFVPPLNDPTYWYTFTVNLNSNYAQSRVRFKFEFTGGSYGNQFYLDDFNISGIVGTEDQQALNTSFDVYPNPAQDQTSVQISVKEKTDVQISILDMNGRVVREASNETFAAGDHVVELNTSDLAEGMYFIVVADSSSRQQRKLIISH